MIRLGLPRSPRWLDLGSGVQVLASPLSTAIYRAATATAYRKALAIAEERGLIEEAGGSISDIPDPTDQDGIKGLSSQFLLTYLATHAITEWRGVGDATGTALAPLTPENVTMLIRDFPLQAIAFESAYLHELNELSAEGSASASSVNGTSEEALDTAKGATVTRSLDGTPTPVANAPIE